MILALDYERLARDIRGQELEKKLADSVYNFNSLRKNRKEKFSNVPFHTCIYTDFSLRFLFGKVPERIDMFDGFVLESGCRTIALDEIERETYRELFLIEQDETKIVKYLEDRAKIQLDENSLKKLTEQFAGLSLKLGRLVKSSDLAEISRTDTFMEIPVHHEKLERKVRKLLAEHDRLKMLVSGGYIHIFPRQASIFNGIKRVAGTDEIIAISNSPEFEYAEHLFLTAEADSKFVERLNLSDKTVNNLSELEHFRLIKHFSYQSDKRGIEAVIDILDNLVRYFKQ